MILSAEFMRFGDYFVPSYMTFAGLNSTCEISPFCNSFSSLNFSALALL